MVWGTTCLDCISDRENGDRAPSIQGLKGVGGCSGNCLETLIISSVIENREDGEDLEQKEACGSHVSYLFGAGFTFETSE